MKRFSVGGMRRGRSSELPPMTWAQLRVVPTAALKPGMTCRVSDYAYQQWVWDGTYWRPAQGHAQLYSKWALLASPLAVIQNATTGLFALAGGNPKIPAGMIIPNSKIYLQFDARKLGANGTAIIYGYLGTAGNASDPQVIGTNVTINANTDAVVTAAARFGTSKVNFSSRSWMGDGNTSASAAGVLIDKSGTINTDADMFISMGVNAANAADSFNFIGCNVILEA